MSNEAQVRVSLQVRKGELDYQSRPTAFNADVSSGLGPSPGLVMATTSVVNVAFTGLTTPGLCWLQNLDEANHVEWGVHDGSLFHPVGELLPGECFPIRLSRNLGVEEDVPGTGTSGVVNSFAVRGVGGTCAVRVEAFER